VAPPSPAAAASAGGEQLPGREEHSLLPGQAEEAEEAEEERGDAGGGAAEGGEGRGEGQQAGVGLDPWTPVAAAGADGPREHDPATLLQEPLQRGAPLRESPLHESPLVRRASGSAHSAALSCFFPQESEVPPARAPPHLKGVRESTVGGRVWGTVERGGAPARALRWREAAARPVLLPGRGRARPVLTPSGTKMDPIVDRSTRQWITFVRR